MRSLSFSLWCINSNLFCLCCLIVINTCQFVYSTNNTTVSLCQCNPTTSSGKNLNATNSICNCTKDAINCTTGYQFQNGTCVKCFCNTTKIPAKCNCPTTQKPQTKLTCQPGQFLSNLSLGQKCENCNCSMYTSLNNNCNNRTGQCSCQQHVTGRDCTICDVNYTANNSISGELLNCFLLAKCPNGFKRTARNECIQINRTSSLVSITKSISSVMVMSSTYGISINTTQVVSGTISSITALTSHSNSLTSSLLSSSKVEPSTYLSPSSSITTQSPLKNTPSFTAKSPSKQMPLPSMKSPSTTIKSTPITVKSPSTTITSPSTTKPPPSTKPPLPTGKPISTKTPEVSTKKSSPTTEIPTTTGQESTIKAATETESPPTEEPTSKIHNTTDKMPSKDHKTDVVVIVLACLGVVLILGIAIAVGIWCLRVKRKPSTPMWTIELSSNTRNEESDFALLDPVTDEPHKKANDINSDPDASITEHSRYYAYI